MIEHERLIAGLAGAIASCATSLVAQLSLALGVPAPTRRQVLRGVLVSIAGVPLAYLFSYGFGGVVAELLTGAIGWVDHDKVQVDDVAGALVVGTVTLRLVPLIGDAAEHWLKKLSGRERSQA